MKQKTQFKLLETELDDVFILEKEKFIDTRGLFVKTFNAEVFREYGLADIFEESVYSISKKDVLRGMHYRQYPYGQTKLVYVIKGEILDVVVGIGEGCKARNVGKFFATTLSEHNNRSIYIPDGYAHGFLCLSDTAIVGYQMTGVHDPDYDTVVRYDSFGFSWPIEKPVLSDRDKSLKRFDEAVVGG